MAHNLFGERFAGFREPAWHKRGTVFTEKLSAPEAVRLAHCDYAVFKSPLVAEVDNVNIPGLNMSTGSTPIQVPDRFVITRQPTFDDEQVRFFGVVSDDYEVLDNMQIADALDVLTDTWNVETVGALDDGKVLFITLDAGEIQIVPGGDEVVHQYFIFTDYKDGKRKARFTFSPVRVVCQNTLTMSSRQAVVNAQITHKQGATQNLMLHVDIINKLQRAQEISIKALQRMAEVEITNEDAAKIIAAAYPVPAKSPSVAYAEDDNLFEKIGDNDLAEQLFSIGQRAKNWNEYCQSRSETLKEFTFALYETINDEHPAIARTPYAAYNAVAEAADWRDGKGDIDYSLLFGARAKEKELAYKAAERISITGK